MTENDADKLNAATDKLTAASHKLAEAMYKSSTTPGGGQAAPTGRRCGRHHQEKPKDDVVDAEFVDVDDKK